MKWTAANIPDQSGRVAVVTGANVGLGYHTSLELARKGAVVVMACRNQAKGGSPPEYPARSPGAALEVLSLTWPA
jgi:NAD(P)-dependent dehydrogenase (short-subunit alcohol dehydrogenase family)